MPSLTWLHDLPYSVMVRESLWGYPILEIVHISGMALLVGAIGMLDLRLLRGSMSLPIPLAVRHLLPWMWVGLLLVSCSGASIFMADPEYFFGNPLFKVKMALIALVVTNALLVQFAVLRNATRWEAPATPPTRARVLAGVSLAVLAATVIVGKWIAYGPLS